MGKFTDLTGQRFGRLVVCRRDMSKIGKSKYVYWICKCDCGRGSSVCSYHLTKGKTKSCGCIRSEKARETILKNGNRLGRKPKKTANQN